MIASMSDSASSRSLTPRHTTSWSSSRKTLIAIGSYDNDQRAASAGPVLRGPNAAAGDPGRDDPHEQLSLSRCQGLHACLHGRVPLGFREVVGWSLDQDAPALPLGQVDVIDLECNPV